MKNLSKKMYILALSIIFGFLGFWFILSSCLTIPGQGLESLNFIKTVEKEINRVMPKGKYLLNAPVNGPTYKALKATYVAEVQSTVVSEDTQKDAKSEDTLVGKVTKFAEDWMKKYIVPENASIVIEKTESKAERDYYDLNWIGFNLIEMDKAISREFYSDSFVTSGIQLFYKNTDSTKKIFSKNLKNLSKQQETKMVQKDYNDSIDGGLTGSLVKSLSVKSVKYNSGIANNKVWFLQKEWDQLDYLLDGSGMARAYLYNEKNDLITKDEFEKTIPRDSIKFSNVKAPNFTSSLKLLQAGVVMTYLTIPFAIAAGVLGTLIIIWNRK